MSDEQSIRDELAQALDDIESGWLTGEDRPPYPPEMAEDLLRHPVIRRIQAEAFRTYAAKRYEAYLVDPDAEWVDQPEGTAREYKRTAMDLRAQADRIEKGEQS